MEDNSEVLFKHLELRVKRISKIYLILDKNFEVNRRFKESEINTMQIFNGEIETLKYINDTFFKKIELKSSVDQCLEIFQNLNIAKEKLGGDEEKINSEIIRLETQLRKLPNFYKYQLILKRKANLTLEFRKNQILFDLNSQKDALITNIQALLLDQVYLLNSKLAKSKNYFKIEKILDFDTFQIPFETIEDREELRNIITNASNGINEFIANIKAFISNDLFEQDLLNQKNKLNELENQQNLLKGKFEEEKSNFDSLEHCYQMLIDTSYLQSEKNRIEREIQSIKAMGIDLISNLLIIYELFNEDSKSFINILEHAMKTLKNLIRSEKFSEMKRLFNLDFNEELLLLQIC